MVVSHQRRMTIIRISFFPEQSLFGKKKKIPRLRRQMLTRKAKRSSPSDACCNYTSSVLRAKATESTQRTAAKQSQELSPALRAAVLLGAAAALWGTTTPKPASFLQPSIPPNNDKSIRIRESELLTKPPRPTSHPP